MAEAGPGVRRRGARDARRRADRRLDAGVLRQGPRRRAGKRSPGVRGGAAPLRHDAHRADPGQSFPGFRGGRDQARPPDHGFAGRGGGGAIEGFAAWTPTRAASWPHGTWSGSALARGGADRQQDARELPLPGPVGRPFSAGEVHPLPPRPPRRGRFLLDDHFQEIRWTSDWRHIESRFRRVRPDHGALAGGLAVAVLNVDVRGDGSRSGRRGPAVGGLVRAGMGAGLSQFSRDAAERANRQRRTSAAADLRHVRGPLAALLRARWASCSPRSRHGPWAEGSGLGCDLDASGCWAVAE